MNSSWMPAGPWVETWLITAVVDGGIAMFGVGGAGAALDGLAARADSPARAIERVPIAASRRTRWNTVFLLT
jgi:hypothetical protein